MESVEVNAYSAFHSQLKALCLDEFPYGYGNWRFDYGLNTNKLTSDDRTNSRFAVTLKDHDAYLEKVETLRDLIISKRSPWKPDAGWSRDLSGLQELSVTQPWIVNEEFVVQYLKTLQIADGNVFDIDEAMLKFTKLEELSLCANNITSVNSRCLPPSLKVLELCGNEISDISDLTAHPPPLVHLGLALNHVSLLGENLCGEHWPHLLSLDLSYNDLHDLLDTINKLATLPKLRSLSLLGNPFCLVPGYRGYIIDSLNHLLFLDEKGITADEKHLFQGLKTMEGCRMNEAQITLEVCYVSGLPMPQEIKAPDDFPEYPKVERRYFVEIAFVPESQEHQVSPMDEEELKLLEMEELHGDSFSSPATQKIAEESERRNSQYSPADDRPPSSVKMPVNSANESPQLMEPLSSPECTPAPVSLPSAAVKSPMLPWMDHVIEYNWKVSLVRDDLLALRDFFQKGTTVSIMEEKVIASLPDETSPVTSRAIKKGKDGKAVKDNKDKKDKKGRDSKLSSAKGKKKKKGMDEDLVRSAPEFTTIATFDLPLDRFLSGDYYMEETFHKDMMPDHEVAAKDSNKKSPISKRKESPKGKKLKSPKQQKNEKLKKPKMGDKGKGKKGDADDTDGIIPPLEVKITMSLGRWDSAAEGEPVVHTEETETPHLS